MVRIICRILVLPALIVSMLFSTVFAAELLDVKPVTAGNTLQIEITADLPMTYTYYKVSGQARAVVDIADVDPEKIEALIVVNKGAISSISVDKAQIAGMVVSRLVFNLVSESDIMVTSSPDRKKLVVSFTGGTAATTPVPSAQPPKKADPVAVANAGALPAKDEDPLGLDEPKKPAASAPKAAPAGVAQKPAASAKEEDPLGLDEPVQAAAPSASSVSKKATPPPAATPAKLSPVVPVSAPPSTGGPVMVKGIFIGSSYIEIQANERIEKFKTIKLTKPDRLAIDLSGAKSLASLSAVSVKRFGIEKVRIGRNPDSLRIVFDATRSPFPVYDVVSTEKGLRINFK